MVLDAKSSRPLAGASVTIYAVEGDDPSGPEQAESCVSAREHGLPGQYHASFQEITDAEGRAYFTQSLPNDATGDCPPGAACAVMRLSHWVRVSKEGYVPYDAPARARVFKLLGPDAVVRNHQQALELANRDPGVLHVRSLVLAEPEPRSMDNRVRSLEARACLSAEGAWSVTFVKAWLPHNDQVLRVPGVIADIEPWSGNVTLVSCPDEGSELEIIEAHEGGVRVRDVVTRLAYQCNGCASGGYPGRSFCPRPLEPGQRLIDLDGETELLRCVPAPDELFKLSIGKQRRSGVGSIWAEGVAELNDCQPSSGQPLVLVQ